MPDEDDPAASRALESSLWELEALSKHFYPPVAKFAQVFATNLTKPKYELTDFTVSPQSTRMSARIFIFVAYRCIDTDLVSTLKLCVGVCPCVAVHLIMMLIVMLIVMLIASIRGTRTRACSMTSRSASSRPCH